MTNSYIAICIAISALVTLALRVLPFAAFSGGRRTPAVITYLGRVLPYAIMGMLVVYCLKSTDFLGPTHGLPELISVAAVVLLHVWRKNTILSVAVGTAVYMLLVRFVFA